MADLAVVVVVVVVLQALALLAVRWWNARLRSRVWHLMEMSVEDEVHIFAAHPNGSVHVLESVPWAAEDFDDRLALARSEARMKLAALNADR